MSRTRLTRNYSFPRFRELRRQNRFVLGIKPLPKHGTSLPLSMSWHSSLPAQMPAIQIPGPYEFASRGWVLYDDACGFCRCWVPFWAATLRRRGYENAPLQSNWVRERFKLADGILFHDLRLLLVDGTQLKGADVYRHLMQRIWWAYPFFLLSRAPVLRQLFDLAYRTFADNRFRVSTACRLPNPPSARSSDANTDIPYR
jgi:predicted DCC family thiol-disulfide oxidoreductase YuxK